MLEQGSIEWHHERAGRVTGTSLQGALGAKYSKPKAIWTLGDAKVQTTLIYELISERMTEVQIVELNTAAVERKHIEYFINNVIPSEYYWQVLSPFVCSDDVEWWDFASYDDRNYECPLFITRIYRKDIQEHILQARIVLGEFLEKVRQDHENLVF